MKLKKIRQLFYSLFFIFLLITNTSVFANTKNIKFQDGDIIFHISTSSQSQALQLATHSKYTHMGIIYKNKDKYYVFEAVQPVKLTELNEWIARGQSGHFVVKRLKEAEDYINTNTIQKIKIAAQKYSGKDYDLLFGWSDEKIYCSELVWKIYKNALNIELAPLQSIKNFDLTAPIVKAKIKERYGNQVPLNEPAISPSQIFDSHLLETVYKN